MMPSLRHRWLLLMLVSSLLVAAVGMFAGACEVQPDGRVADRQQVLRDLTANVIVPTYADLTAATMALAQAVSSLRAAPNAETLAAAQAAYRAARSHYKQSEAFYFGPIEDIALTAGAIESLPSDPAKLEARLGSAEPIDANSAAQLGANARGFVGLEVLLFDSTAGDAAVLARFLDPTQGGRRAALAESLAGDLLAKCRAVFEAWNAPGGFAAQLAEAGLNGSTFRSQSEGIDKLVTGYVYLCELMVMRKLGKPLGVELGGAVQPQLEEAPRSDSTLLDLRDNLVGMESLYSGARAGRAGKGLGHALHEQDPAVAQRFEQALAAAHAQLTAVPPPFRTALLTERASVEALYQALRALKLSVQTELASALGASIGFGFSDTD